jgi:hypothetical protein
MKKEASCLKKKKHTPKNTRGSKTSDKKRGITFKKCAPKTQGAQRPPMKKGIRFHK